jgi:small subunit ribosomal protein S1
MQQNVNNPVGMDAEEDFASMFEASLKERGGDGLIKEGDIVKGTVITLTKDFVVVDIGYKSEGQVPIAEFTNARGEITIKPGDPVEVLLESRENDTGMVVLSKEKADKMRIWDEISAACERDEIIKGVIVGRVKGGLSVDIGVKAFLPGSQVDIRPVRNLDQYLSKEFEFKVIKFNKKRGNIVLSRRVLLEKQREEQKKETLKNLKEGAILKGQVKNLTDYGAFIDLGGIDGLLHITDMSWGRVGHPSEMFNVGDEVRVVVLKFDPAAERVSLGLKQIQEDPWHRADEKYPVGTRVKGKVVSITDYGAFIEIEPGVEGLVHVTEMSWTKRVKHPSKGQAHCAGHEADRAEPLDAARGQVPHRLRHPRPGPQRHRLRHLRRRRGGRGRPGARVRHQLDPAHQAPGRPVQEG